jgi:16S rRNA (guanine527-N7)-methyltransferase
MGPAAEAGKGAPEVRQRRRRRGSAPARRQLPEEPRQGRDFDPDLAWLLAVIEPYSIPMDARAPARLRTFAQELLARSERLNLLSHADAPLVIRKHVAASLGVFLVAHPCEGEEWIDVGTGAGFPGLVLKIAEPSLRITLLDSARKRCLFLEGVVRRLDLGRVPVMPLRAENLVARGEDVGRFAVLTARAVTSLVETVRGFGPLVAPGGRIVTFKGPGWPEEIKTLEAAGLMGRGGVSLDSITRIPWVAGHIVTLRNALCPTAAVGASPAALAAVRGDQGDGTPAVAPTAVDSRNRP